MRVFRHKYGIPTLSHLCALPAHIISHPLHAGRVNAGSSSYIREFLGQCYRREIIGIDNLKQSIGIIIPLVLSSLQSLNQRINNPKKVGLTTHCSLSLYRESHRGKTNDTLLWTTALVALQKSRINDTLILTSISIYLHKVRLTLH